MVRCQRILLVKSTHHVSEVKIKQNHPDQGAHSIINAKSLANRLFVLCIHIRPAPWNIYCNNRYRKMYTYKLKTLLAAGWLAGWLACSPVCLVGWQTSWWGLAKLLACFVVGVWACWDAGWMGGKLAGLQAAQLARLAGRGISKFIFQQ